MASQKELSWEFLRETFGRKYFLIKRAEKEFFVFRTPGASEKSKDSYELLTWVGEVVPWGLVPVKVRIWLKRKGVRPDVKDQKTLHSEF